MPVTNQALPSGYALLNYRIDRQISRGGFSIVYRAFDETGQPVAIKEYLPSSLVLRTEGDVVRASDSRHSTLPRFCAPAMRSRSAGSIVRSSSGSFNVTSR